MSTADTALDPELSLPEPEPRDVLAAITSVDDHLVEPRPAATGPSCRWRHAVRRHPLPDIVLPHG